MYCCSEAHTAECRGKQGREEGDCSQQQKTNQSGRCQWLHFSVLNDFHIHQSNMHGFLIWEAHSDCQEKDIDQQQD